MDEAGGIGDRGGLPGARLRIALAVLLLLVTAAVAWRIHEVVADRDRDRFDAEVQRIDTAIEERMRAYVQVLRGGAAFFAESQNVSLREWLGYVTDLRLDDRYPGFKSLSYAPEVPRAELGAFAARVRVQRPPAGIEDPSVLREFAIKSPTGARDAPATASPIVFVAPFVPENTRVLGVDMLSEPVRRAAMERARATGEAALSPRLKLSGGEENESGFIVYLPITRAGRHLGWLTAAFQTESFMSGLLGESRGDDLRIALSDGTSRSAGASLLWSTEGIAADRSPVPLPDGGKGPLTRATTLAVPERTWTVQYAAEPRFTSAWTTWAPLLVIAGGLVLTTLLVLLARASSRWRRSSDLLTEQAVVLREARDDAQAADRAKATFLATVSHEIRTPMNAVIGMSSLLLRSPLEEEQQARARVIRSSGEHLLQLINEILDFSKIEAGHVDLEDAPVEVAALVSRTVDLIRAAAEEGDIAIDVTIVPGTPDWVRADGSRLRQVLLNLLANAVRHAPASTLVTMSVQAERHGEGWLLAVAVGDRGPGLAEADHERLFRPFEQGPGAAGAGGTGLGLSIAQRLVEAMGGEIGVDSVPGEGATFRFTAVTGAAEPPALPESPDDLEPLDAHLPQIRVLVAEDNPLNQLLVRDVFAQLGTVADVVGDGAEALAAVERQAYDVVLLDLRMPVLDGLEAARRLVASIPAEDRPRIVAMTADVTAAARAEAAAAGMDDFVAKPLSAEDLATVLQRSASSAPA